MRLQRLEKASLKKISRERDGRSTYNGYGIQLAEWRENHTVKEEGVTVHHTIIDCIWLTDKNQFFQLVYLYTN